MNSYCQTRSRSQPLGLAVLCLFLALPAVLAACSTTYYTASYNSAYIPFEESPAVSAAGAALVMSQAQEQYMYSGEPRDSGVGMFTMTRASSSITIPLGEILKKVSLHILEAHFSGGVQYSNEWQVEDGIRYVIQPEITRFEYSYSTLRNLEAAITPEVRIVISAKAFDYDHGGTVSAIYDSGVVTGRTCIAMCDPMEEVNSLSHQVLYRLMKQAVESNISRIAAK